MTIASPSWRRALVLFAAVVGTLIVANPAQAQEVTGARANKDCPGTTATPGQTIICNFEVENTGNLPATVTTLREISPFPGGVPINITCTTAGGMTITVGSTLAPGTPCTGTFQVTIPNDPALCGTAVADRVEIALRYSDVLVADAGATGITLIVCPADITITKTADALSKVGDSVTYTFRICNVGAGVANRVSVSDTLLGILTTFFPATLAPGQCVDVVRMRVVQAGDPDPLPNTVTAIYSSGLTQDTATASASTNLFQPSITLNKTGDTTTSKAGDQVNYTITVNNTSSSDSPNCVGNVVDPLLGINQAINLAPGASTTINASRIVLAGDPDPLVNTATATCSPVGFPNVLTASDTHTVDLVHPNYTLTKECAPSSANVGDQITYTFVVTNTGDVGLNRVSANDTLLGNITAAFPASLAPGASATVTQTRSILASDPDPLPNTVTVVYQVNGLPNQLTREASCSVDVLPPKGGEGCTPGFWKQDQHFDSWTAPFDPSDSFDATFGVDVTLRVGNELVADPTLLQALQAQGGGINALARHAVAALLNAASPDVDSDFTVAEVIALVQEAITTGDFERIKNILAAANEQGCPLN